jgi:hypothetical protein
MSDRKPREVWQLVSEFIAKGGSLGNAEAELVLMNWRDEIRAEGYQQAIGDVALLILAQGIRYNREAEWKDKLMANFRARFGSPMPKPPPSKD